MVWVEALTFATDEAMSIAISIVVRVKAVTHVNVNQNA